MNTFSQNEIKALKFYEGDIQPEDRNDPFYGDDKAYVTLNSLLFTGIETEIARTREKRKLNTAIALDVDQCLFVYQSLYSACLKDIHSSFTVYRVERLVDYKEFLKEGCFTSFISTSKNGFMKAYQDKYDLVLMEIVIEEDTLCFCYDNLKNEYAKADEAEVLLPPYYSITVEELPFTEEIKQMKDGRGNQPVVYCRIHIGQRIDPKETCMQTNDEDEINAVKQLYHALNQHESYDEKAIKQYTKYKQKMQQKLREFMKQ